MRQTTITCDNCGTTDRGNPNQVKRLGGGAYVTTALAWHSQWLRVRDEDTDENHDFCGWACCQAFAATKAPSQETHR